MGTDPENPDSDGDGLSEYIEKFVLLSDDADLTKDFLLPETTVPFIGLNGVNKLYEALLYSEENGLLGKITVNLSSSKAFSGDYIGVDGARSSLSGTFDASGTLSALSSDPDLGWTDETMMVLQKQSTGRYHLNVKITTESGDILYAKARPAIVTTPPSTPYVPRSLTFEAKPLADQGSPTGSAVATGTLSRAALASFTIYLPDESIATHGGSVLDGDVIALFATNASAPNVPVLLGNLKLDSRANLTSNLAGVTRLITNDYDQVSDQVRQLNGAFYVEPRAGTSPLNTFAASTNNALLNWSKGELDGAYQVVSWAASGAITPPRTTYDSMTSTFTRSTGLIRVVYTRSDKDRDLFQTRSTAYAVVNQGMRTINGFYVGSPGSKWEGGDFSMSPNTQRLPVPSVTAPTAPIVIPGQVDSISPADKDISSAAQTYSISVKGTNNWDVEIPADASWITRARVVNVDGSNFGNTTGRHDAAVQITVAANTTDNWREADILIGGVIHTVSQKPAYVQGTVTAINLRSIEVRRAQTTYSINVTGTDNWQVSIPSSSNWISVRVVNPDGYVYPKAPNITGSGNATVQVTVANNATNRRREGSISIGGITHSILQAFR